jgi:antitoxin component YwqK of YwqJK toxin-antitoxin module
MIPPLSGSLPIVLAEYEMLGRENSPEIKTVKRGGEINHEIKLTGFVNLKNNKQHGEQIVRYPNGQKHGKWWEWYRNGRLSVAGLFENGYARVLKARKPCGERCPLTGVVNGYGWWVHYDSNGEELDRTEISGGKTIDDYEIIDGDDMEG